MTREAVLFRMHRDGLKLVCAVRGDVVRLTVNESRVRLPKAFPTLDDVMTDWPTWLRRQGWRDYDPDR